MRKLYRFLPCKTSLSSGRETAASFPGIAMIIVIIDTITTSFDLIVVLPIVNSGVQDTRENGEDVTRR